MRVLALVCSPMDAMFCAYLLRRMKAETPLKATLVVYGKAISMPPQLIAETMQTAGIFFPWEFTIDFCAASDHIAIGPREEAIDLVRQRIGEADLIITHSIHKLPERAILDAMPEARIVLYDNGIASHLERPVNEENKAWRHASLINARDLARVETAHYLLGDVLPVPPPISSRPCVSVSVAAYRDHLYDLLDAASLLLFGERPPVGPCHLMLGTSFYRTNRITFEEERAIYQEKAEAVLADPKTVILFKEHPRANAGRLISARPRIVVVESPLPVEFLPLVSLISGTSSMGSTALLTLHKFFGIKPDLLGIGTGPTDIPHVKLLTEAVTSIS